MGIYVSSWLRALVLREFSDVMYNIEKGLGWFEAFSLLLAALPLRPLAETQHLIMPNLTFTYSHPVF